MEQFALEFLLFVQVLLFHIMQLLLSKTFMLLVVWLVSDWVSDKKLKYILHNQNSEFIYNFQVILVASDKQLETDSFMELLFLLVGCLADWEFVAPLFKSVVHKVMTTMMITGMVEIILKSPERSTADRPLTKDLNDVDK